MKTLKTKKKISLNKIKKVKDNIRNNNNNPLTNLIYLFNKYNNKDKLFICTNIMHHNMMDNMKFYYYLDKMFLF